MSLRVEASFQRGPLISHSMIRLCAVPFIIWAAVCLKWSSSFFPRFPAVLEAAPGVPKEPGAVPEARKAEPAVLEAVPEEPWAVPEARKAEPAVLEAVPEEP